MEFIIYFSAFMRCLNSNFTLAKGKLYRLGLILKHGNHGVIVATEGMKRLCQHVKCNKDRQLLLAMLRLESCAMYRA